MTGWYHFKRSIYTIIIIIIPTAIYNNFSAYGLSLIPIPICIVSFFINITMWIDDTKKWNKGVCKICSSPWLAAEGNVYDETEYHCKCGRTFWC